MRKAVRGGKPGECWSAVETKTDCIASATGAASTALVLAGIGISSVCALFAQA